MQTNKILLGNIYLVLVGIFFFSLTVITNNENYYFNARGEYQPYSIVLETNKNKIGEGAFSPSVTHSGNGTATTELGNAVAFEYNSLYNPTSMWQTIKAGGYITNTQSIMGMTSITLVKHSSAANFGIYWSKTKTFTLEQYELFDTTSSLTIVCLFAGYLPNYIKIEAVVDSEITGGSIEFSCTNNYPTLKGDLYTFGTYPQSKITDSNLIATLNTTAGTLPTSDNSQSWTDYGYYISDVVSSFMWYIDLTSEANPYRGVYFTSYRPWLTTTTSSADSSYQDNNGYSASVVYWFKYEPITWRVIDIQEGKALLVADLILDSQDYYYSQSIRTSPTISPNNYEYSHIRSWLNDNFYNTAFSIEEKARIQTTTVDNSDASTGYNPNPNACSNTNDKAFLLSYLDITNPSYGLNTVSARQLKTSAYSQSQGAFTYTNTFGLWWLRSPNSTYTSDARLVLYNSNVNSYNINYTFSGIVPSLWILL